MGVLGSDCPPLSMLVLALRAAAEPPAVELFVEDVGVVPEDASLEEGAAEPSELVAGALDVELSCALAAPIGIAVVISNPNNSAAEFVASKRRPAVVLAAMITTPMVCNPMTTALLRRSSGRKTAGTVQRYRQTREPRSPSLSTLLRVSPASKYCQGKPTIGRQESSG